MSCSHRPWVLCSSVTPAQVDHEFGFFKYVLEYNQYILLIQTQTCTIVLAREVW